MGALRMRIRIFCCVLLIVLVWCHGKTLFCESPQYIKLGKVGIINCTIDENYFGIYWYNSSESRKNTPLLSLEGSTFGGAVYPSNEFHILDNGSLSINEVTLQHEHIFRIVLVINKELGLVERMDIETVVIVRPSQYHPQINRCGEARGCMIPFQSITDLKCAVSEIRPVLNLTWVLRTSAGDIDYPSNFSVSRDGILFSAVSEISKAFFNSTVLLVCKSEGPISMLKYSESFILIEINNDKTTVEKDTSINVELGAPMILKCGESNTTFVKWERKYLSAFQPIAFATFSQPFFSQVYVDKWDVNEDGSLITDASTADDEGVLTCLTGDGSTVQRWSYGITVLAYPHPATPVIEGCGHYRECSLKINQHDIITCSLYGIRPLVQLEWIVQTDIRHGSLRLQNQQHSTTNYENGTFDVHLKTEFYTLHVSKQTITVVCQANIFEKVLSTSFHLLLIDDQVQGTAIPQDRNLFHLLWIAVPVVCFMLFGMVFKILKTVRRTGTENVFINEQEMAPMMGEEKSYEKVPVASVLKNEQKIEDPLPSGFRESANLKGIFLQQLRNKYKLQYEAIRPIPYSREIYNVKGVFVESTIEQLNKNGHSNAGSWKTLKSYHELLKFELPDPSRTILQGDPGYGKSTLTLKMAYDWSTKQSESPLCAKEILILLRLRQLFSITSIYRAIRLFLLPRDTIITDSDVREILQKCSSAVIILDGFDEYPHQDEESMMDVNKIIAGEMFQEFQVILCTRPLLMPSEIPPSTQRTRLNGFDRALQEKYIQKTVTRDTELAEKIRASLNSNPVLEDFCEVPLFFVMFAHVAKEDAKFQEVNSATSFFRLVIRCFHSHLQNKLKDENVGHYKEIESDHSKLDELSFQSLASSGKTTWEKNEFREHVGGRFYEYYLRLGILCEEETFDPSLDESLSEVPPYRIDVHFSHKIFCEWYAAHHLSRLAENMSFLKLKKLLKKLDLFELHYVFRFACGLSENAARKILKHLYSVKAGQQFSILCILEQTGKFIDIKETVLQLCSEAIHLSHDDNRVLQRSTIQLMVIASKNEVPISSVWLRNCLNSVDESGEYLRLSTGLSVPRLDTITELHIYNEDLKMTTIETTKIIKFAILSSKIKEIRFYHCDLPRSLDNQPVLKQLSERGIKVSWSPNSFTNLLLDSRGLWENKARRDLKGSL